MKDLRAWYDPNHKTAVVSTPNDIRQFEETGKILTYTHIDFMKDQLEAEKAELEKQKESFDKIIEDAKIGIHWVKKRLKLVEEQLKSLEK